MNELVEALKSMGVLVPTVYKGYSVVFYCEDVQLARTISWIAGLADFGYVILGNFKDMFILNMRDAAKNETDGPRLMKKMTELILSEKGK